MSIYPDAIEGHPFVGEIIWGFNHDTEKTTINIKFKSGRIGILQTEVDCCNRVWFEVIDGLREAHGATILAVIKRQEWTETADVQGSDECEDILRLSFKTTAGDVEFELRNNHNGYYAGTLRYTVHEPMAEV